MIHPDEIQTTSGRRVSRGALAFHGALTGAVAGMLLIAQTNSLLYEQLVQEDRVVEWLTVAFFLGAAAVGGRRAVRHRSVGDGLVALFCVAAAGEEVSWGQRLVGFTPPELFLANNAQQEANLHNLFEAFGEPKWTLIAILLGYGVVLPFAARVPVVARLAEPMRFTPPPGTLVPWYVVAVALLVAYPVRFTGEWVEALAGCLFFISAGPTRRVAVAGSVACLMAAVAADRASGALVPRATRDPRLIACAHAEARALRELLTARIGEDLNDAMHRRVWSVWLRYQSGELPPLAGAIESTCGRETAEQASRRRHYAVDPWGNAYWLRVVESERGVARITVYSFGPNRRRDISLSRGDDIASSFP